MAKRLRDDPSRVIILGGGQGGLAMFEMLQDEPLAEVIAIVDVDNDAPGMVAAKSLGVQTFHDVETALLACAPCVAFNLTGNEMVEEVAAGILGAGGVIGGLEARLMWRMVTDLKNTKKDLEFLATHDPLTSLYNRRYITEQLEREVSHAVRYGVDCSLVILDLDRFKDVNDVYGHLAGDAVLKHVSQVLKSSIRASDILGRWGGEEFLILLPHTPLDQAALAVQKWLDKLQRTSVHIGEEQVISISFSAGVSSLTEEMKGILDMNKLLDVLLEEADLCLYAAKDAGRACVMHQHG